MRNKTPIRANRSDLNRSISANRSQAQNQSGTFRLNASEFGYQQSQPSSRMFNPRIEQSPFANSRVSQPFNDSQDKSMNSNNVKKFFDEFNSVIQTSTRQKINL